MKLFEMVNRFSYGLNYLNVHLKDISLIFNISQVSIEEYDHSIVNRDKIVRN